MGTGLDARSRVCTQLPDYIGGARRDRTADLLHAMLVLRSCQFLRIPSWWAAYIAKNATFQGILPLNPYWRSGVSIQFGSQYDNSPQPFAGLVRRVYPELPSKLLFSLRWGLKPSEETPSFEVVETDAQIPFELTLDESYQLTASVGGAVKSIFVKPFKVLRASLYCSGAHVRYSNVVVSAQ
jgi:hypothetical protein